MWYEGSFDWRRGCYPRFSKSLSRVVEQSNPAVNEGPIETGYMTVP
jgi:hypothetical protein